MMQTSQKLCVCVFVCMNVSVCLCTIQFFCKTVHIKQLFWVPLPIIPHSSRVLLMSVAAKLWNLDSISVETTIWE